MVEHRRADSWVRRIPTAEWRRDNRGHAASEERYAFNEIGIQQVGSSGPWRRDMLEKAAPFVEVYDEHGVGPLRSVGHSLESLIEEQISFADVGVRMIVISCAVVEHGVSGIDEGNSGERPGGSSREKFRIKARNAQILRAPQGHERDIGIKIIRAHSGSGETIPNRRERSVVGAVLQAVGLRGLLQ